MDQLVLSEEQIALVVEKLKKVYSETEEDVNLEKNLKFLQGLIPPVNECIEVLKKEKVSAETFEKIKNSLYYLIYQIKERL